MAVAAAAAVLVTDIAMAKRMEAAKQRVRRLSYRSCLLHHLRRERNEIQTDALHCLLLSGVQDGIRLSPYQSLL